MFDNNPEKAIQRIRAKRAEWNTADLADRAAIAQLRSEPARDLEAILEGAQSPAPARIGELETAIAARERNRLEIRPHLVEAVRALNARAAAEVRKQAGPLAEERERILKKRARLLADLKDLEGIDFTEVQPDIFQDTGQMADHPGQMISLSAAPQVIPTARSVLIGLRIGAIEREASELEKRDPRLSGEITANELAGLLAEEGKPGFTGPTADEIRAWFGKADAMADQDWTRRCEVDYAEAARASGVPGFRPATRKTIYRLRWDADGRISGDSTFQHIVPAPVVRDVPVLEATTKPAA